MLIFHAFVVIFVCFAKVILNRYIVQTVLVGDFIEIVGMGFVVVQFLYQPEEKSNANKSSNKTNNP